MYCLSKIKLNKKNNKSKEKEKNLGTYLRNEYIFGT